MCLLFPHFISILVHFTNCNISVTSLLREEEVRTGLSPSFDLASFLLFRGGMGE